MKYLLGAILIGLIGVMGVGCSDETPPEEETAMKEVTE